MAKFWKIQHLKTKKFHIIPDKTLEKLREKKHLRYYSTPVVAEAGSLAADYVPEEVISMEKLKKPDAKTPAPEMVLGKNKIVDPAKTDPGNKK